MHPSRSIHGRHSELLAGRRVILGVSGSIAAIEAPRIARELIRHGADVRAVMSSEATRIVTAEAMAFATGHPPIVQLSGEVEHVSLLGPGEERADLLLIAPATANTISKVAQGIDDTPVTTFASVALGGGVPVMIAPAMHGTMGENPAVKANLQRLRDWGVEMIAPQSAEGEEKLATPEDVAAAVLHRLARGPLAGRRVLVIGGASREPIDAVRSVTNESSGETAVALATQAHLRGAQVELWAGALQVTVPGYLSVRRWGSVADLVKLVEKSTESLRRTDAILVPAALSDFTLTPRSGKIPSRSTPRLELDLVRAPKLLPRLRRAAPHPTRIVGFKLTAAAGPETLAEEAERLLAENDLDLVVANDRASMGQPTTNALVIGRRGARHWLSGKKSVVSGKLLDDLGRDLAVEAARGTKRAPATRRPPRRRPGSRRPLPSR